MQAGRIAVSVGMFLGLVSFPGAEVLRSITVDGDTSEWSDVLADPFQTGHDGPSAGLADRDAPVPSTGRDLLTFAWTYDTTALYFYVERVASDSNRQQFWFYIDTDENDRMDAGEPVVQVSWWGRNRTTRVQLYRYQPASPDGDPLGDPSGFADGWTMPGTVYAATPLYETRGGSHNGTEMEAMVRWSDLGIAPGTPVRFHVSSSNSENVPQQIHDNMGGPGGIVGTTRIVGVLLSPPAVSGTVIPAGDSWCPHTVTNTGAEPGSYDLTWSATGDFAPAAVTFLHDADGDGTFGAGDLPLVDTDGNGLPDTGALPPAGTLAILVVVSAPAGVAEGQTVDVEILAASTTHPEVHDTALDTIRVAVPGITLVKTVDRTDALPGATLSYSVSYTSSGSVDARQVVVLDEIPEPTTYVAGSAAGPGADIDFSHDGGTTFDASEAEPVTHIRWRLQAPLSPGDSGVVSFQVRIP